MRLVNGSGTELVREREGLWWSIGDWGISEVEERDGNSRKLQRKRRRNAPPNMKAMLIELKGFNGISRSFSLKRKKRRRGVVLHAGTEPWRRCKAEETTQQMQGGGEKRKERRKKS